MCGSGRVRPPRWMTPSCCRRLEICSSVELDCGAAACVGGQRAAQAAGLRGQLLPPLE